MKGKEKIPCSNEHGISFAVISAALPRVISRCARLCPPFGRVIFFALWAKSKGVPRPAAHFYRGLSTVATESESQLPLHRGAKKRSKLPLCHSSTKNVTARRSHLNILPQSGKIFHTREARISPRQRRDFTRRQAAVYHCGAKRRKPRHSSTYTST